MSETSHYLNTGHSCIYVLNVREVTSSKHRSLIYIRPKFRDVTSSKHRSLIYIRPKCQRRHII